MAIHKMIFDTSSAVPVVPKPGSAAANATASYMIAQ